MSRYIWPVIIILAGFWARHYNGTHSGRYVMVPFLDLIPGYQHPRAHAQLSWQVLIGLGVFWLICSAIGHWRQIRKKRTASDAVTEPAE